MTEIGDGLPSVTGGTLQAVACSLFNIGVSTGEKQHYPFDNVRFISVATTSCPPRPPRRQRSRREPFHSGRPQAPVYRRE